MQEITFRLDIPAEEYLRFYRGEAQVVIVKAPDGRRVQLPAANLRPFVGMDGVHGRFVLRFDGRHKLVDLRRVGA